MATSGVRDGAFTVAQIIADALPLIQVGVGGETIEAEYQATCITTLKLMARAWAIKGVRLFLNETQTVTFVDGTATYTLSPRSLECYAAWRRTGTGSDINDTPIQILTRQEYEQLPNKATAGAPFAVYLNRQRTSTTASFYPVPDAAVVSDTGLGRLLIKRQIEDVTAAAEDMEVPAEWIPAVTYNLAIWVAPKFNKTPSREVMAIAAETFGDIDGQDREGSVYMRPGPRR